MMYAMISLLVVGIGAVLRWGVADRVDGVAFDRIGLIMITLGIVGLLLALIADAMARRSQTDREVVQTGNGRHERIRHT